jgi:hypothetical protein
MMHRGCLSWLLGVSLLLAAVGAQAHQRFVPPLAYERDHQSVVVASDGSFRSVREQVIRVETPAGIEAAGVQNVFHNGARHEVESIKAWTIQPDGEVIEVAASAIHRRDAAVVSSANSFSEARQTSIVFPKVAVGSRLRYIVTIRCHTPQFPGHFMTETLFTRERAEEDFRLDLDLPQDMPLHVEQRGVTTGLLGVEGGRARHRFSYRRTDTERLSARRVDEHDEADVLRVSTLPDPLSYGALYQSRAAPMSRVTPALRAQALDITRGQSDLRARVRALHHWVASRIRYISVALDNGAFVPRPAEQILASRYGDCKDHVVLLEALLAALDIESSPALINLGQAYRLAGVGLSGPLNHVITYVPALDLYIDSTDPTAPFGTLPFEDLDKPVILTALNRLGRTPSMKAAEQVNDSRVDLTVKADGRIVGRSASTMTGVMEGDSRAARSAGRAEPEAVVVSELLARYGETGSGTLAFPDPLDLDQPWRVEAQFELDPIANVPGPAAMKIPVGLSSGRLAGLAASRPMETESGAWVCPSRVIREHVTIRFAPSIQIIGVPRDLSHVDQNIRYRSHYQRRGQQVVVSRELAVQYEGSVCTPEQHVRWRQFLGSLQRDVRAQVVYR